MSASCIYEGWVRHRRVGSLTHELRSRLFMLYLDLDELPSLFDGYGFASARGRAFAEFRRSDHFGDPRRPLTEEVRDLVDAQTASRPQGPVRLLTHLRCAGHCFNPVSFYYCFKDDDAGVSAVVAEVTNTPWGERHVYVLSPQSGREPGAPMRGRFEKRFHVSPFMGMDHHYDWRLTEPGTRLIAHIESAREHDKVFDATLSLRRRELSPRSLGAALVRQPLLSMRIVGQIYAHGLRLKLKGARYFPNPSGAPLLGRARREHAAASRERAAAS